jgi:hypothetical protein
MLIVSAATPINMKNWTVQVGLLETTVTSAIFTLFLLLSSNVQALLMLPVDLL